MDRQALLREAAEDTLRRESEARRFLYADVETMISSGRLTQTVSLDGNTIVFHTLMPSEVDDLLLRSEHTGTGTWARMHIASSVYMINGFVVEPQYGNNQAMHVYNEWARDVRDEYVEVLYAYITSLRFRLERAVKVTDAYCHEAYSRSLWRMVGRKTGERNIIQQLWTAYNETEDRLDADNRTWAHTRAIAGSMSSKASKSLLEASNKWERQREDRARRIIEDAVNRIISGTKEEQEPMTVTVNGQTYIVPKVHAAQTVEEMEEEMVRSMRGEKDYHDMLVEQYKESHRNRLEEARQKQREAIAAAWGDHEEGLQGETRFVGYTPDQLASINPDMLRKKPNTQRAAVSPEQERFTEYLGAEIKVGWLGHNAVPEEAKTSTRTNDTGDGGSLQDKISRRIPTLKQ